MNKKISITQSNGSPVAIDDASISAGEQGPLTFDNWRLFEKLAHFNRERIPERVVHARGTGVYGTFRLTHDLSCYTQAKFLQNIGSQVEVFVRFSTVGGGQDSSDYARDPRGFAVKFYTSEGNFDIVGNNTPVFFLRDPIKFPDFVHSQKKNPQTNLPDPAAMYEFWANHPQSLHQLTILMSDRGIPFSYRHMDGFSSHTLSFWNLKGERFWVKWHFKTQQGIRCLTNAEAAQLSASGAQQDLVEAIEQRNFPHWIVKVQIATTEQLKTLAFNPFDLTKIWPHQLFPLQEVGVLELNRNVKNYFAEVEQAAFSPSNLIPGIGASPDKMLQARLLAYPDAHRYRVGVNVNQLPVNAPRCPVHHYQRDGAMAGGCPAFQHNQNDSVNFYPNDRAEAGAPIPDVSVKEPPLALGEKVLVDTYLSRDEDNFSQAGDLFRLMSVVQQQQLASNIAAGLQHANASIQQRMLQQFASADRHYAGLVQVGLQKLSNQSSNCNEILEKHFS